MRIRFSAALVGLLLPVAALAQSAQVQTALQYAEVQSGLHGASAAEFVVSDAYTSRRSGTTHVYLRQALAGIEVIGTERTVNVGADGRVFHAAGMERALVAPALQPNAIPSLSPEAAASALAQHNRLGAGAFVPVERTSGPDQAVVLSTGGVALEPVPARLVWHQDERGALRLAWEVGLYQTDALHYWLGYVDAQTGHVLAQHDLVVYDTFGPADGAAGSTAHAPSFAPLRELEASLPSALVGSYTVYPMPVEAPIYAATTPPADGRTVVTNPDDATASPYGWHDTNGAAGAEYTITRGNNVHAYTDIDANNSPDSGSSPSGGASLVFNFPLNLSQAPSTYRPAAVTNLFYWNNIIHDVLYQYGFDEASGNFQVNNYGRGGSGNDDVRAEAQDGSGVNNANFFTPSDGSRPRMQMYIGTNPNPDVDGDFDNGVIVHEYGHGVSNRLTGGRFAVNCLSNAEQMGEGWSDYYALMLTMDGADARTQARGIGNYLFGQPTTGVGIRPAPYSTSFAVNNYTYQRTRSGLSVPHGIGFVWATILWEVTWDMIDAHGFSPDFYNAGGSAGNQIMLQLVTEGLKLQPCSPGFVSGRDAILAADVALYGGAHLATLQAAFARRGLGYSASQGSTSSNSDNTEAFDLWPSANEAPTASFSYSCTDLACAFTDTSSDADGTIASRAWTFGDGGTSSATHPNHTYGSAGAYTVTLTVTDDDGASDTASQTVTVTAPGGFPIDLTVTTRVRRGETLAQLRWSPADGGKVDIFRNGTFIKRKNDNGSYNDNLGANPSGSYAYQVCETDSGDCSDIETLNFLADPVAASAQAGALPAAAVAYPNPFNPSTTIRFGVPDAADVELAVYNSIGRRVALLADGRFEAGTHQATFEASALPSGVYLYRLRVGADVQTGRLMLVK